MFYFYKFKDVVWQFSVPPSSHLNQPLKYKYFHNYFITPILWVLLLSSCLFLLHSVSNSADSFPPNNSSQYEFLFISSILTISFQIYRLYFTISQKSHFKAPMYFIFVRKSNFPTRKGQFVKQGTLINFYDRQSFLLELAIIIIFVKTFFPKGILAFIYW